MDRLYMQRCIELAKNGIPYAAPNPVVGAVIVCDGKIIGEGYHRCCGGPHAEVNAVNSVKDKSLLTRSTIYVTLEPCSHYGKTPPCADMLISYRLKRVVVGCVDPFAKVCGNGINKLREAGIEVTVGVCEDECLELIRKFRTFHKKKRPYIILKWAQSADGFIDREREGGSPTIISNPFTQMLVHKMRHEASAIMIGTNTAILDNPSLTNRKWIGKSPVRVVIDRKGKLPESLNIFDGKMPTLIFSEVERTTEKTNVEYIKAGESKDYIDTILSELYKRELQSLIVEGGSILLQNFIDRGLWDECIIETGNISIGKGIKAPVIKDFTQTSQRQCFGSVITKYVKAES